MPCNGHRRHTLQMEEDVGLVVLEHLGHQLDIHVLDIDILTMVRQTRV